PTLRKNTAQPAEQTLKQYRVQAGSVSAGACSSTHTDIHPGAPTPSPAPATTPDTNRGHDRNADTKHQSQIPPPNRDSTIQPESRFRNPPPPNPYFRFRLKTPVLGISSIYTKYESSQRILGIYGT
ncbi:hypothetical protein, partial [Bifidobacterium callitrichos]|uniref:hypothetical protein n=1 Tax=Bifidobacterium callitrichos TaxID=762209 RepID=UPI001C63044A